MILPDPHSHLSALTSPVEGEGMRINVTLEFSISNMGKHTMKQRKRSQNNAKIVRAKNNLGYKEVHKKTNKQKGGQEDIHIGRPTGHTWAKQ